LGSAFCGSSIALPVYTVALMLDYLTEVLGEHRRRRLAKQRARVRLAPSRD